MELAKQIRGQRMERGLSQEDLAAKIYVSRQTVSNWETDKTYPDVQSLLLLSVLFEVTVDELIKGDMNAMKEAISNDRKKMVALAWRGIGIALVGSSPPSEVSSGGIGVSFRRASSGFWYGVSA